MDEFKEVELLKVELGDKNDRVSQVKILAEYLLKHSKAEDTEASKSSTDLWELYEKLRKGREDFIPEIPRNTFVMTLFKISREQNSTINCEGRRQGYYLEKLIKELEVIAQKEQESESKENNKRKTTNEEKIREKNIYPILKDWLFLKDFDRVADISNKKANGKWGNPDLIGLKIEDVFGHPEIEITTLEVKLTNDRWEEWIFESIAHTRFSNRSYFAFLFPDSLIKKLDSTELKSYAEHFGIGILIIEIAGNDFLNIKKGSQKSLSSGTISRIFEYYQAPYRSTNIKFRKKFLKNLGIIDLNDLYSFGESNPTRSSAYNQE